MGQLLSYHRSLVYPLPYSRQSVSITDNTVLTITGTVGAGDTTVDACTSLVPDFSAVCFLLDFLATTSAQTYLLVPSVKEMLVRIFQLDWNAQSVMPHLTQYTPFRGQSSKPMTWLLLTNKQ